MAKKSTKNESILPILLDHYQKGTIDNDQRRLRENGWNDTIKAYYGKLDEATWPYLSMVSIPLIRTTILEKNARLFNGKLRGRLVPREGGDMIKAKLNNALLEFQWDNAELGGSMLEKWALMDVQTRLFGASFALVYWRTEESDGKRIFDGNEMKVLDNRDVVVDYTANHVKNANWVQVREWKTYRELEEENESSPEPMYINLSAVKDLLQEGGNGDRRDAKYDSVVKDMKGLEDRVGSDTAFPTLEVVTEYRKDRWITFCPRLGIIIRDVPNPYKHKRIPVIQLRYYGVGDDIYGESEVEPVLPVWRAITALLCGTIDEINLRQRPPVKIANNQTVRMDTIEWGPNAQWIVGDSTNNVQEMVSASDVMSNFQTIYSALLNAYNTAMGEMSQGVGVGDPFATDKTATEVRASERQKLSRDQQNQIYLEQALKDQMLLWLLNNQQFLFDDPTKKMHILRIVGKSAIKDLQAMELDQEILDPMVLDEVRGMINETDGEMSDFAMNQMLDMGKSYKHSVIMNPEEQDPANYDIQPKLKIDERGESGELYLLPEDVDGVYDYIPSVQSMALNANEANKAGRGKALEMLMTPEIQGMLQVEQEKVKIKDLLVQVLEDNGLQDADKFFERVEVNPITAGATGQSPEVTGVNPAQGMVGLPANPLGGGEAMLPQPQGV
jgi:uncharacterized protein YrzB (UPF0473 family)